MKKNKLDKMSSAIDHYYKMSKIIYSFGGPNFWYEDFNIPEYVKFFHDFASRAIDVVMYFYFAVIAGAFFTQPNLNEKQEADRLIFSICFPTMYTCFYILLVKDLRKIRDVLYTLVVELTKHYNDGKVEKHMIKQVKFYIILNGGFVISTLSLYGVDGVVNVYTKNANFITVIPVWPDVMDTSSEAGVARVFAYLFLWIFAIRIQSTGYFISISSTICLAHKYRNLCSYFISLNDIFKDNSLSQNEKEIKYEHAYIVGVKCHSNTLRCTQMAQEICNSVFGCQIMANVIVLILVLYQMTTSDRSLTSVATILLMAGCILISTGCIWWNAGDVTVEASYLPTMMFCSGWQKCEKTAARRVRPLLVTSMAVSQKPVQLRCLKTLKLSYSSYVTILKTSYSIFSVLF